jgi:hypothetical protein
VFFPSLKGLTAIGGRGVFPLFLRGVPEGRGVLPLFLRGVTANGGRGVLPLFLILYKKHLK